MTRRAPRPGDRVTVGKRKARHTVVAVYTPPLGADGEPVATIVARGGARAYWSRSSKRRGVGRRVPLAKLSRA